MKPRLTLRSKKLWSLPERAPNRTLRRLPGMSTLNEGTTRVLTYAQALNEALLEEMERDPRVVLLGEDIGEFGGLYSVTRGLLERFGPARVMDTPTSEAGFVGAALGLALTGYRPVVEIMFVDFIFELISKLSKQ